MPSSGNHGSRFATSASRSSSPRSHRRTRQIAVNDFEIEPISNIVRSVTGAPAAGSAWPYDHTPSRRSRSQSATAAPGVAPAAISRWASASTRSAAPALIA